MIYLIDGHNLIGKMPDIKLADPNDEEKLVRRLHNWAAGDKRRQIELFFDSGDFGGWHTPITAPNIRVYYARQGQKADDLLIRALRVLKNRQAYTLITSDNEILAAARKRRVGYVLSEEFAALMAAEAAERLAPPPEPEPTADPGALPQPEIRPEDVAEWLAYFGDVPESGPPPLPAPPPAVLPSQPPPRPSNAKKNLPSTKKSYPNGWPSLAMCPKLGWKITPPPSPNSRPTPNRSPASPPNPKRLPPNKNSAPTNSPTMRLTTGWMCLGREIETGDRDSWV